MSDNKLPRRRVVFDDPNSGIVRYVRDSILHGSQFSSTTYSLKSNEAVIEYVSQQMDAIGLIGGGWISDRDDSTTNGFLGSIRVAAIEHDGKFYKPYQAYIATRMYPLTREIIISSREPRTGLGSGFMSFVAGDKGQRVILKAGLLPVTMPIRLVQISREAF
jgi:phosphate transport system substrate-binding protein